MFSSSKVSYILSGTLICLFGLLSIGFINSYLVKLSTEKYVTSLMQDYRRELINGSRTIALQRLTNKLGPDFGFVEIEYSIPGNQTKHLKDTYADIQEHPFYALFYRAIESKLFYDTEKRDLAVSFSFYYRRFNGILFSFISWILFCSSISIILHRFYLINKRSEAVRNASERSHAVAQVVQMLSHDMRAPLGTFERLLSIESGSSIDIHKPAIRESLNRLHSMIESLRHSEVEILIERRSSEISFEHGFESLSNHAHLRRIALTRSPIALPPLFIDANKFERAWINLVTNAISAASSWVRLDAEIVANDLILRITDNGPGIPDHFLPRLFQRGATHGKADGTGLGLAYVRQIMRGHGGDVAYRREKGLTVFECRLPNAVERERGQVLENVGSFELKQEARTVAICLEPQGLSDAVLAKLASHESDRFFFTEERARAQIVVSNVDTVMFEVLDGNEQEFVGVAQLRADEGRIVELLKRKFNLQGNSYV